MQVGNKESINCDKNEPTEEDEHEEDELKKNMIQSLLIELVMNVSLEFEQKAPSKGNIIRSKAELKQEVFECHQCGKTFTNRCSFNHHKNEHTDKYWCKTCDKRFPTNQKIKNHSCAWVLKNRKEALNNESTETIAVGINQTHKTSAVTASENNISSLEKRYPGLSIVPKIRTT